MYDVDNKTLILLAYLIKGGPGAGASPLLLKTSVHAPSTRRVHPESHVRKTTRRHSHKAATSAFTSENDPALTPNRKRLN